MVCSKNLCNYNNYYTDQAGGNLDILYYKDLPNQRGKGIISTYAKRYGIPVMKYLLKQGFYTGRDILRDVIEGKNVRQSSKSQLKKRTANVFKDLGEKIEQSGSGLRKKPKIVKRKRYQNKSIKRVLKRKVIRRVPKSKAKKSKKVKKSKKINKDIFY